MYDIGVVRPPTERWRARAKWGTWDETSRVRAVSIGCLVGSVVIGLIAGRADAGACAQQFDSTFALIQGAIFERRGCTSALCHDASASGGLNLTAGVAYDNLVDAPVQSIAAAAEPAPRLRRRRRRTACCG